ncbi:MAG: hypothetical protein Phog2KO_32100 [Phototrophicaceae bacterium]
MNDQRILAWQLYAQTLLLLVLYSAASLLSAIKFMPLDPLANALPYVQISGLEHVLLDLALLAGIFASSVYFLFDELSKALQWVYRAWTGFLVLTVLAGLMGFFTGQHMLELPFLLDIALLVLIIAWSIILFQGKDNAGKLVLITGLLFVVIGILFSLFPASNPLSDRIMRVLTVNMRVFVGYPLAGLVILYWIYEDIPLHISAGILAILGSIASIAPLNAVGIITFPAWVLAPCLAIGSVYLAYTLISSTQAWQSIAILLMILGIGVLGTVFIIPEIGSYAIGTRLSDLQVTLVAWSVLLIIISSLSLSLKNSQIDSVTNSKSLTVWLILGGIIASTQTLLLAGVVQVFLERVLSVGYLDTQTIIIPLYTLWIIGILILSLGLVKYTYHVIVSGTHLGKTVSAEV